MQSIEAQEVVLESPAGMARLLMEFKPRGAGRRADASCQTGPTRSLGTGGWGLGTGERMPATRTCSCGACRQCRDNARWERIFNEKFADRAYYGRVQIRHNSSLAGI